MWRYGIELCFCGVRRAGGRRATVVRTQPAEGAAVRKTSASRRRLVSGSRRTWSVAAQMSVYYPQQTLAVHRSIRDDVDRNGNRKAKQARKVVSGSLSYKLTGYRNVMRWLLVIAANSATIDPPVTPASKQEIPASKLGR